MSGNSVEMLGKHIQCEISRNAEQQLRFSDVPLYLEMELYFSCMIRKQVNVREHMSEDVDVKFSAQYSDNLRVGFRPVMTKSCSISSCEGDKLSLSNFPIRTLSLIYQNGLSLISKKVSGVVILGTKNS